MFPKFVSYSQENPFEKFDVLTEKFNELESEYYTYNFKILLHFDDEGVEDKFFKILLIKAQQAHLFAVNILSCKVTESSPNGFTREIEQKMGDKAVKIIERVIIAENEKTILFIQLSPTNIERLTAINQVVKEDNKCYFVGKYIFEIKKENKDKTGPFEKHLNKLVEMMKEKLFNFYESKDVDKEFSSLPQSF